MASRSDSPVSCHRLSFETVICESFLRPSRPRTGSNFYLLPWHSCHVCCLWGTSGTPLFDIINRSSGVAQGVQPLQAQRRLRFGTPGRPCKLSLLVFDLAIRGDVDRARGEGSVRSEGAIIGIIDRCRILLIGRS